MIVHDRLRACLTWPTRYVTVRHHVEIAPGALAERGTYDLPALQVLAGMASPRPFLFLDLRGRWQLLQRLGEMSTDRQLDLVQLPTSANLPTLSHHPVCPCSNTRTEVIHH